MSSAFGSASHANPGIDVPQGPRAGIFVRVEFGVSFTPERAHGMSMSYASRRESLFRGPTSHQTATARGRETTLHPDGQRLRFRSRSASQLHSSPESSAPQEYLVRPYQSLAGQEGQDPEHHRSVREFYGPQPSFNYWEHPDFLNRPAESSQRSYRHQPWEQASQPAPLPVPYYHNSLPVPRRLIVPQFLHRQANSAPPTPLQHKPLPPLPSTFRLGEDDLPWSSPTWEPEYDPILCEPVTIESSMQRTHSEDPQRMHELESLQEALLSVDSMEADWWDPGDEWDSQGELAGMPRGPRGVGWAVRVGSSDDLPVGSAHGRRSSEGMTPISPPPSYTMSEWERHRQWNRGTYYGHTDMRRRISR